MQVLVAPESGGEELRAYGTNARVIQALEALCLLARLHHVAADAATLAHQLAIDGHVDLSHHELLRAARHIGLKAKIVRTAADRLSLAALPALARVRDSEGGDRWVLLAQCDGQRVLYQAVVSGGGERPTIEPLEEFIQRWTMDGHQGELMLATSRASLVGEFAKFDFSWFIPSLVRYRRLASLKAPVNGTVQQLAVHTTGGVVTPAQVLLVVVPEQAQVTAEVMLENKDIGFVREGQAAEIKLETFPYVGYGTISARVENVTADAVVLDRSVGKGINPTADSNLSEGAVFPARLSLKAGYINVDGRSIAIVSGMNITAEVIVGGRSVLEYLMSPVLHGYHESFRER